MNSLSKRIKIPVAETKDNIRNKIEYIGLFIKIVKKELKIKEIEKKRAIL
jgi:hypothetical protein